MPLGNRGGAARDDYKYVGVETDFNYNMPAAIFFHVKFGIFDFVLSPLTDPSYRPSFVDKHGGVIPFPSEDTRLFPVDWEKNVTGKVSSWIDLDSEDEILRTDSEIALKQEVELAIHLSLQACILPAPKSASYANYARCVNQILLRLDKKYTRLLLRFPVVNTDDGSPELNSDHLATQEESWEVWNAFRLLCDHHPRLGVALEFSSTLPPEHSLERWLGEPVFFVILQTEFFSSQGPRPSLSKERQEVVARLFDQHLQITISGICGDNPLRELINKAENSDNLPKHPLKPYLDYVATLFKCHPLHKKEFIEFVFRDRLHGPMQFHLSVDAMDYEKMHMDKKKYTQYQRAVFQALMDRVPDEKASSLTTVLVVVGAGHGGLVNVSLQAAKESGRKLKVYAVEKNLNAVVKLNILVKKHKLWKESKDKVTIVSCDVRFWDAPEKADILVSDLLGSFGDDQLSPECLDSAQRFLKEDGISIPASYTNFILPVTAAKIYIDLKREKDLLHYELRNPVKFHSVTRLAPPQPVFIFFHPNRSAKINNQRYKTLQFELPRSALVHGFAGFFNAVLYKGVRLGNEAGFLHGFSGHLNKILLQDKPEDVDPKEASASLRFPMYFPLRIPVQAEAGKTLEVSFWRRCDSTKLWYEWSVMSPSYTSQIHNINGRSHTYSF